MNSKSTDSGAIARLATRSGETMPSKELRRAQMAAANAAQAELLEENDGLKETNSRLNIELAAAKTMIEGLQRQANRDDGYIVELRKERDLAVSYRTFYEATFANIKSITDNANVPPTVALETALNMRAKREGEDEEATGKPASK